MISLNIVGQKLAGACIVSQDGKRGIKREKKTYNHGYSGCYVGAASENDRALDNMKEKYSDIKRMWTDMKEKI